MLMAKSHKRPGTKRLFPTYGIRAVNKAKNGKPLTGVARKLMERIFVPATLSFSHTHRAPTLSVARHIHNQS